MTILPLFLGLVLQIEPKFGPEFEFRGPLGTFPNMTLVALPSLALTSSADLPMALAGVPILAGLMNDISQPFLRYSSAQIIRNSLAKVGQLEKFERLTHKDQPAWRVHLKDGHFLQISSDHFVMEVQTKELTASETEKFEPLLQTHLFDSLKAWGIKPAGGPDLLNATHLNISWDFFVDRPLLFRNFIVDLVRHRELYEGVLLDDSYNAKSWSDSALHKLRHIIQLFDDGLIEGSDHLAHYIDRILRAPTDDVSAISLRHVDRRIPLSEQRIETRFWRAAKSAADWTSRVRLIRGRLKYLESLSGPLAFPTHSSRPPVSEQLQHAEQFVVESGFAFKDYIYLLKGPYAACTKNIARFASR